jgi:asparagine synthase (glutamine-hydrolysing)
MSGIIGIVNFDGSPIEQWLLRRMTESLAYRGPDAQEIVINSQVGFGHTMLRTTDEAMNERQPCSLDGRVWITADARIDGRADLIRELRARGRDCQLNVPDVELILHAYHIWDEECVSHLLGDFAFAIWDERQQKLFCARDHFGIKPFFYSCGDNHFVFSNTLNCIRLHPAITDELNEQAIGDFLLFDSNRDPATTAFAGIRRLPPAHCLVWSEGRLSLHRYWTLPDGDLIKYRRERDYIEHFLELLRTAVADRLRTENVGILMSGGLDSASVAAIARELTAQQRASFDLQAHTVVYDRLIPDQERYYAGLVADALQIPIHYLVADDYLPYQGWDDAELQQPEPVNNPLLIVFNELTRRAAAHCRVVLTGDDGDTFLEEWSKPYFSYLFKNRRFGRLFAELVRYARTHKELPRIGLRHWFRQMRGEHQPPPQPDWLNRSFATRLNLSARWNEVRKKRALHPIRPKLYHVLTSVFWSQHFEAYDAGLTSLPVEYRHPLADLRLLDFALSIPPVPWLVKKHLLRVAMKSRLPEEVCVRPKSPLAGDPLLESIQAGQMQWAEDFSPVPKLTEYVERDAISPISREADSDRLWMNIRPLSLNYWLLNLVPIKNKSESEERNGYQCFAHVRGE